MTLAQQLRPADLVALVRVIRSPKHRSRLLRAGLIAQGVISKPRSKPRRQG